MCISFIEQALQHCEGVRDCLLQLLLHHAIFSLPGKLQGASQPHSFYVVASRIMEETEHNL